MNRVLIVDDKEENLYFLQVLLGGHGYAVDTARHGAEALVKARMAPPDMVVSDLLMPIMDGYTLLRHWKADPRLKPIPFVVYTATYTEAQDEQLALDLGADSFILKPAEPDVFIARIREAGARVGAAAPTVSGRRGGDEKEVLKAYSETLIRKLEEKALQLEDANRALQKDIAEREKMTTALKSREAELRLLTETIPHIVWLANPDGELTRFNQRWFDYTGLSLAQSAGQGWLEAVHPDDRGMTLQHLVDAFNSGQGCENEFRLRWADGSYHWMLGRALPLQDADGSIVKWFGTSTEIDGLKQAEELALRNEREQRGLAEQLETERARLEMAQSVAKVGSWETDMTMLSLVWSAQTYSIFEIPVGTALIHENFVERVHPEDRSRVEAAFTNSLHTGSTNLVEHRIVMPDGRI
ncbi:MAG: PAS domain-containing protein, partial [Lacisediminimonas sp.]|nr:PAS domain-containing protein [Lacisediminimonas sp.]